MEQNFERPVAAALKKRLGEPPSLIQILAGPRQVGKTTLVRQVLAHRSPESYLFFAADAINTTSGLVFSGPAGSDETSPAVFNTEWLIAKWTDAQRGANTWHRKGGVKPAFVLVIDEIQRVPQWSITIKGLWDTMKASASHMHVVLLGSSPLLMQKGLVESLAGRFEITSMSHWSFTEMNQAFGHSLDQYLYFGGFPGSAPFVHEETRWRNYVNLSLIRPNIEIDILMLTRVDKPALLRQLFELGCLYSAQVVALDKLLGQLHDAGNVTTLARYLDLLGDAGLLCALQKHSDGAVRRRRAAPKLQALNNALVSAQGSHSFAQAMADRSWWGRLTESAVGAQLVNSADNDTQVRYWKDGPFEVDFVIERRGQIAAIEVKSAPRRARHSGLDEFARRHPACRIWQVGGEQMPIGEVLQRTAADWL